VPYLQSQNGNLYASAFFSGTEEELPELAPLRQDVPPDIPWCTEALGAYPFTSLYTTATLRDIASDRHPDAVNLWLGGDRSVTSIHSGRSKAHAAPACLAGG